MHKFVSNSHACLNVVLPSGGNAHISFTELTGKGSVFYTDDEELASALKAHHRYGKLFKEVEIPVTMEAKADISEAPVEQESKEEVREFSNIEDAKEYFAERYGVSRSKLRTRASIEEVATGLNMTVKWSADSSESELEPEQDNE